MPLKKFDFSSLIDLDGGRVKTAVELAIKRCELDCSDRPGLKKARRVSLNIDITPVIGEEGNLESCDLVFQVVDTTPKRTSKVYNMKATGQGLLFNEMSPEDHGQLTFEDAESDENAAPVRSINEGRRAASAR